MPKTPEPLTDAEIQYSLNQIGAFLTQLRSLKFSDTGHFREMCVEYAREKGVSVERAAAILKPICDAREKKFYK